VEGIQRLREEFPFLGKGKLTVLLRREGFTASSKIKWTLQPWGSTSKGGQKKCTIGENPLELRRGPQEELRGTGLSEHPVDANLCAINGSFFGTHFKLLGRWGCEGADSG
jgi:hypothetical protein